MIRAEVRAQLAGDARIEELINELLRDDRFDRLRVLMAFARWSGLSLIDDALRAFAARAKSLEVIVGVDLGGTTGEALEYLLHLPNSRTWVFRSGNPSIVFHPKAFSFTGPSGWSAVIGSANATSGGLFTNAELVVHFEGDMSEVNPLEAVWSRFDGSLPPLTGEHVAPLSKALLDRLSELLVPYTRDPPDRGKAKDAGRVRPLRATEWPPHPGRPPRPDRPEKPKPPPPAPAPKSDNEEQDSAPAVLFMEVWGETGGGNQVQFGQRVVREFFRAASGGITWVELDTPLGRQMRRVGLFANDTARISLTSMKDEERPAVVRMTRLDEDRYRVESRPKGHPDYPQWLARCTEQTRSGSKRYGLETIDGDRWSATAGN